MGNAVVAKKVGRKEKGYTVGYRVKAGRQAGRKGKEAGARP